jgi:hypothetical protein
MCVRGCVQSHTWLSACDFVPRTHLRTTVSAQILRIYFPALVICETKTVLKIAYKMTDGRRSPPHIHPTAQKKVEQRVCVRVWRKSLLEGKLGNSLGAPTHSPTSVYVHLHHPYGTHVLSTHAHHRLRLRILNFSLNRPKNNPNC